MSFANEIKQELSTLEIQNSSLAELSALIKVLGVYSIKQGGLSISIENENIVVILRVMKLLKHFFALDVEIATIQNMKFGKKQNYLIRIMSDVDTLLSKLQLKNSQGFMDYPTDDFFLGDDEVRQYLSGLFLAVGSINSPENTNYHLEFRLIDKEYAQFVIRLLKKIYIEAKMIKRRDNYIVYVKASEQIGDFLRAIWATNSLIKFEDIRIRRDFRNNITRLDNCEAANDLKVYKAGQKQLEAIENLKSRGLFEQLDEKLKEVALLRIEHPEESLTDLVFLYEKTYQKSITKSGMAHRFRKINQLSK